MAACITGALCADWVEGEATAPYAKMLAPARYEDAALMAELNAENSRGHL